MPTMTAKPITADCEGRTASPPLWPKIVRVSSEIHYCKTWGRIPSEIHYCKTLGLRAGLVSALSASTPPCPPPPVAVPALPLGCGGGSVARRG
jgi:hypothetical protein